LIVLWARGILKLIKKIPEQEIDYSNMTSPPVSQANLTIPNFITLLRILLTPLFIIFLIQGAYHKALFVFLLAGLSDLADGLIARTWHQKSRLGSYLDPLADKVLVCTALIMLIPLGRLPAWVALLILCREMIVTGLRGIAATTGIVVSASGMGKIKSIIQYIGLGTLIFPLDLLPLPFLHRLGLMIVYVSVVVTIWSGVDYFLKLKDLFLAPPASR